MRGIVFINQASPNPCDFVRGDGHPDPAAADADAAIYCPGGNCPGQGNDKVRIVIVRLQLPVPEIRDYIARFAQFSGQKSLQLKAAVVSGNANALGCCHRAQMDGSK